MALSEIPDQNAKTVQDAKNLTEAQTDHNEQSDDSALGCRFDDSVDEVSNYGIYDVL
ncbi:hypothetical protein RYX36_002528, partial [Vicia faba]